MSTEIENRVVQMKFDNKQFESGTKTTMSTLDKLKEKLKFNNITDGFSKISSAAKNVDMSSIANGAENVKIKFSALEVIAMTALSNITNSAINTGKQLVSAFTIDPIKSGLEEYETQINAVQTILANTKSKGSTIDDVNNALDTLNTYADKTIYNFTEMTRNIGTFTAAGVDLQTSTDSIKGIANLAAISGSTSQQASTAMYQLSQALAAGKVSLMDWNSVVNAGMGGEIFQEALKRTARNLGKPVDEMIEKFGSFRESLTEGEWMTTEVLTETLKQLSGAYTEADLIAQGYSEDQVKAIMDLAKTGEDAATKVKTFTQLMDTLKEAAQSGWTQTWEYIIGDFEEAKEFWTGISDTLGAVIQNFSDRRNMTLAEWKNAGGRTELLRGLGNVASTLGSIFKAVGDAWNKVFPRMDGTKLAELTKKFADFTEKLKWGPGALKGVQKAFEGVFSVLKLVGGVLTLPLKFIPNIISLFSTLGEAAFKVGGFFGNLVSSFINFATSSNFLETVVGGISWALQMVIDKIKEFIDWIQMPMDFKGFNALIPYMEIVKTKASEVKDKAMDMGKKTVKSLKEMDTAALKSKFKDKMGEVKEVLSSIGDKLSDSAGGLKEKVKSFVSVFSDMGTKIKESFKGVTDWVSNLMSKINWDQVIATFSGLIAGKFFWNLSGFIKNLGNALSQFSENVRPFGDIIDSVTDALDSVQNSLKSWQNNLKASMLLKIGASIAMIAGSIYLLSKVKMEELIPALTGIGGAFIALTTSMILLDKFTDGTKLKGMLGLASAVLILSLAVKQLEGLNPKQIVAGCGAITAMMIALSGSMILMSNYGGDKKIAGLIGLAGAVLILSVAVKQLGSLDIEILKQGLIGIGIILAEIGLFANLVDNKRMISIATGMLILSASLTAMVLPIKILSMMSWDTFIDGLAKVGLMISIMGAALNLMPTKGLPAIGFGLMEVAVALLALSGSMKIIGNMKWEEIKKGLVGLGVALVELALALNLMKGTQGASVALLIACTSLIALAGAMKLFGNMSWSAIAKGLVELGVALTLLGVAGYALAPVAPALLAIGAAFMMISGGLALATGAIAALVFALGTLGAAAIAVLPVFAASAGAAIVTFIKALGNGAVAISDAAFKIIVALLEGLNKAVPVLVETIVNILDQTLKSIANHIESIASSLLEILIGIIRALRKYTPTLVDEFFKLIVEVCKGIFETLNSISWSDIGEAIAGAAMLGVFLGVITALSPFIGPAMLALAKFSLLVAEASVLLAALGGLAQIPGFKWLVGEGGELLELVGVAIGKFVGGIVGGIAEGATSTLPKIGQHLSDFMSNASVFFDGCKSIDKNLTDSVASLVASVTMLTNTSLMDSITEFLTGDSSLVRFGKQIAEFAPYYKAYSNMISGINAEDVQNTSTAIKTLAEFTKIIPNKGGLVSIFTGDNTLSDFAEEMCKFAPYYKAYSNMISGVNASDVQASSAAAKSIAEFAKAIPNKGGLVALFTGENTLSDFAKDLAKFGPSLKKYSESVTGLNVEAVESSVTAIKAILKFAKDVPNQGGVFSWFVGDNTLSEMGKNLSDFGPSLKKYSECVTGLSLADIDSSLKVSRNIIKLMDDLPDEYDSLYDFGIGIVTLGKQYSKFCDKLSDLEVETIDAAIYGIRKIVNLVRDMSGLDINTFSNFINNLGQVGIDGVNNFTNAFENGVPKVEQAVSRFISAANNAVISNTGKFSQAGTTIMNALITAIQQKSTVLVNSVKMAINSALTGVLSTRNKFNSAGITLMTSLINGISSKKDSTITAVNIIIKSTLDNATKQSQSFIKLGKNIIDNVAVGIRNNQHGADSALRNCINNMINYIVNNTSAFGNAGISLMNGFSNGIRSGAGSAYNACASAANNARYGLTAYYNSFYNAGAYLMQGFANGINSNAYRAAAAAKNAAYAANKAARNALGIHSPSKVGMEIGKYFDIGFANGISKYSTLGETQSSNMAEKAKEALRKAIAQIPSLLDSDINLNPVITPVIDLNGATKKIQELDTMFSRNSSIEVSTLRDKQVLSTNLEGTDTPTYRTTGAVTYIQNNYSPKALSSIDIYRQTKNQISLMKGKVN